MAIDATKIPMNPHLAVKGITATIIAISHQHNLGRERMEVTGRASPLKHQVSSDRSAIPTCAAMHPTLDSSSSSPLCKCKAIRISIPTTTNRVGSSLFSCSETSLVPDVDHWQPVPPGPPATNYHPHSQQAMMPPQMYHQQPAVRPQAFYAQPSYQSSQPYMQSNYTQGPMSQQVSSCPFKGDGRHHSTAVFRF